MRKTSRFYIYMALSLMVLTGCEMVVFDNPFIAGKDIEFQNPAQPDNIRITNGDGRVTLQWDAVIGADSYEVYYGSDQDSEAAIPVSESEYRDTESLVADLENESLYYVWVRSVNDYGKSSFNGPVFALPTLYTQPPDQPTGLQIVPWNNGLFLFWEEAARGTYYQVYYSETSSRDDAVLYEELDPVDSYCRIDGLTNGTEYHVWVQAVNGYDSGPFSDAVADSPIPVSEGFTINVQDIDFNHNSIDEVAILVDFSETIGNSEDLEPRDFEITDGEGNELPINSIGWNDSLDQMTLNVDVSSIARVSIEDWILDIIGVFPLNEAQNIPYIDGSDLTFKAHIVAVLPPTGLDNGDLTLNEENFVGDLIYENGSFVAGFTALDSNSLYVYTSSLDHSGLENFTLHYSLDGAAWMAMDEYGTETELYGYDITITGLTAGTHTLDIEYIYDLDSVVKSESFDSITFDVN